MYIWVEGVISFWFPCFLAFGSPCLGCLIVASWSAQPPVYIWDHVCLATWSISFIWAACCNEAAVWGGDWERWPWRKSCSLGCIYLLLLGLSDTIIIRRLSLERLNLCFEPKLILYALLSGPQMRAFKRDTSMRQMKAREELLAL